MSILVTAINHFSLRDGPGIRTTIFFKGCSLHCPWCCNPESISDKPQQYTINGIIGTYGKYYEIEELLNECLKDKEYYGGDIEDWNIKKAEEINLLPGGITFSGGECLLRIEQLVQLITALHQHRIHITAETSLFIPPKLLIKAINYIDLFYVDIKILDEHRCMDIQHGDFKMFLSNLDMLAKSGKPFVFRVPVIGTYTDDVNNRKAVKELIKNYTPLKVELLKEHNFGNSKYHSLGIPLNYHGISDSLMHTYQKELSDLDIPIEIKKSVCFS